MPIVGLIVNPIAGMGGNVGLKGTDGEMYKMALALGAKQVTSERIREVLSLVTRKDIHFMVAAGSMGEDYIREFSFDYDVIGQAVAETTSADTKNAAREMVSRGIDLLIFVGGDGTARDILDAVGVEKPVIGIPSGVKMFSSVFALSAHAAAEMINSFGDRFIEKDVLDIDEEAFRNNRLVSKLYGFVRVPDISRLLQGGKAASNVEVKAEDRKKEVAEYIVESMENDELYILGPGTTLKAVTDRLGVEKTLLGVDAVFSGRLVGKDINEEGILELIKKYGEAKIIVTPIGGNGFIFGRGSKQISPQVLDLVKRDNIIIVSTPDKVVGLECLRVDTGDYRIDKELTGKMNVVIGYNEEIVMEVRCD
ncbi:ATP-NAD/AcoX kinase (plasmid) [Peptoclostridium acidaminophilum DSM 3953]|uniref:ATP-NAD/AcoX kinase n=1 Tax=Peptoclostridium acidaminophilum DSM 3953 TaxID=1286171 RepID=W8UAM8_PEPAC|nr:ATP-NAD kinase family protein [Peptoclostridium acidaminophilum]AHM57856.1 ATP-NAD/AcoX kinase [Peptoclostridium acidaminophilum DSM 3953]